jgi:hypothetical protein
MSEAVRVAPSVGVNVLDSDADGLDDDQALSFCGTLPYQFDTDGAGLADGQQIALGLHLRNVYSR